MSTQPPPDPSQPWRPPAGWSEQQPPAWPTAPSGWPAPGAGGAGQPPTGGAGQPPTGGAGQPPTGGAGQPRGWPGPTQPPAARGGTPQTPPGWPPTASATTGPGWWGPPAAPKPGIVPLRPLGAGELLEGALGLIRSNPRTVLGLAAIVSALLATIQTLGVVATLRVFDAPWQLQVTTAEELAADASAAITAAIAQLVPALLAGFLQIVASGLFIMLVAAAVLGRRLDAGQSWRLLRPRLVRLLGLALVLAGIGIAGLTLVGAVVAGLVVTIGAWAILPAIVIGILAAGLAIWVYVRLSVAAPALVVEGRGLADALRRSWRLVAGSWWRVAGILLLSAIIANLLTVIVSVPITTVSMLIPGVSQSLVAPVVASGLTTMVAGIVVLPFSSAVIGLLYTDLRMRREGLDAQLARAGGDTTSTDPLAPFRGPNGW